MKKPYYFHELPIHELKGKTILLDIDGTLVCDGDHELSEEVAEKVIALKEIAKIFLVSNKPNKVRNQAVADALGVPIVNSRYRKPHPRARGELVYDAQHTIVIGDKFLTDGLFAYFLKVTFIRVRRYRRSFWRF